MGAFVETARPFLRAKLMLHHSAEGSGRGLAAHRRSLRRARARAHGARRFAARGGRFSTERAGLELLARSLRHLLRRNYLTLALLAWRLRTAPQRGRLEELMQMLTHRLSLLFEFAPPDFYERSTFASHIDNPDRVRCHRCGRRRGRLHLGRALARGEWKKRLERLLPADAVFAIQRVAALRPQEATRTSDAR